jgi:23S rRNA (uridine2552-2'-O)-methyltransferase
MAPRYEPKDAAYRAASIAGFRSRAALKLRELDAKFGLLRPGARVLDLGCWPGGWLQVAARAVGPGGLVVGVDREPVEALDFDNVKTIVADVSSQEALRAVEALLTKPVHVVLSDLAPKLTGVRDVDRARHAALCECVIVYCERFLDSGGRCLVKLFSDSEADITELLRARFAKVSKHRPGTTRKGSSEIYAVASGYARPTSSGC